MADELMQCFAPQLSGASSRLWLPFERDILHQLLTEDALVVMAKGLGLSRLFATFSRVFCSPKVLVLCLLANDHAPVLLQQVMDLGLNHDDMNRSNRSRQFPRLIDNKSNVTEREQLYKQGGCFFITSRILVVDMLNNRLDRKMISGLLVYDAHRVTEASVEAFIIRLYREANRNGFLKAFSQEPQAFCAGFHKLEHTLKLLFLRKVLLFPRFHVDIHHWLSQHQPQVYEIGIALTSRMHNMQQAILVALEATLKELQRSTKCLDATELTMENALTKSFANLVRSQLDPVWHQIPFKTKQLVGDLTTLRQLLSYLTHYDAISYYSFLLNHQTVSGQQRNPSPWLFSEAADRLMHNAKARLYKITKHNKLELVLETNPKWEALAQVLEDIEQDQQIHAESNNARAWVGGSHVLVLVKDDRTAVQLREFLALGGKNMLRKRFGHYLKQKVALWSKRTGHSAGGSHSNSTTSNGAKLSAEQKLLMEFSKTFDGLPTSSEPAKTDKPKGKGPSRKRPRTTPEEESSELLAAQMLSRDSASYGMSIDDLETFRVQNTGKEPSTSADQRVLELLRPSQAVSIATFSQAWDGNLLELLMPQKVVLYDANVGFVRELEHFHARHGGILQKPGAPGPAMEIFFLYYEESAEQQLYLHEVATEKKHFETLIRQKNTLMLPLNVYDIPLAAKVQQNLLAPQYSMDTRTGGKPVNKNRQGMHIIVDVREFRGALPSMLHREGLVLSPVTLEIGDFILSPLICVERKSISDLYGSFSSGRLFNQASHMSRFYQIPVLLIEFTEGKAFSLQDASEISNDISPSNIISKLVLLILHFPQLRILWSRSPHATVDIFKALKKGQEEPSVEVAMAMGNPNSTVTANHAHVHETKEVVDPNQDTTDADANASEHQDQASRIDTPHVTGPPPPIEDQFYNMSSMDLLKKLPGINEYNYRRVLAKVTNLAELSRLNQSQMVDLLGKQCGKKLFEFFNNTL